MNIKMFLRNQTTAKYRKVAFIKHLPQNACVLDVGCGNKGPMRFKMIRPDIYYVGIDIDDYNNTRDDLSFADEYIKTQPESFANSIRCLGQRFDAVVSSHNLEHCNNPKETLKAICEVTKPKGLLFLAFPSNHSVSFPSRKGTLNYYDDPTHIYIPNFCNVLYWLKTNDMEILVQKKRYRPILLFFMGLILEPISAVSKRVLPGTWALWGFESVVWAKKQTKSHCHSLL